MEIEIVVGIILTVYSNPSNCNAIIYVVTMFVSSQKTTAARKFLDYTFMTSSVMLIIQTLAKCYSVILFSISI